MTHLSISGLHSRRSGRICSHTVQISSSSFPPLIRRAVAPLPLFRVPQDGSDSPQSGEPVCRDVVVGVLVGAVGARGSGRGGRVRGWGAATHWSSSERMRYALEISFSLAALVMFKNESGEAWGQHEARTSWHARSTHRSWSQLPLRPRDQRRYRRSHCREACRQLGGLQGRGAARLTGPRLTIRARWTSDAR